MKNMTILVDIRKMNKAIRSDLYRLESELAVSETANAAGDDMRVVPGYGFTLEGHANSAFNQDWLVVRVEHFGKQTGALDEEAGEEGNRYENTLS